MQIREYFEIKPLTTYKIGGKVKKGFFPETVEEFTKLLRELDEYIVLGSCSDVLFSSNGYSGNVIITTEMKKFEIPVRSRKAPKIINTTINLEHTLTGVERIPSFV